MPEKFAVGVDFGGTKILAGVVNLETGRLIGTGKKKTRQVQERDDVIKRISSVVDKSLADAGLEPHQVLGIGIGAAGQVNRDKGILIYAANIGVSDLSLTQPLTNAYDIPCVLGNDVEIATLGEMYFGAGRKCDNFVCIFVGTGIGSGIVQDGRLYRGSTGTAGEVGHIVLDPFGRLCGCGSSGCLEAYASRTAVAKEIVGELARGSSSLIKDRIDMQKGILRSKALSDAIAAGDEVVTTAVTHAAQFLGMGLATVMNFYNPQRIILGGGLVEACDYFFDTAAKQARQRALKVPAKKVEIVKAELGDFAGIIGAALMVKERVKLAVR
jgi:glucokinase